MGPHESEMLLYDKGNHHSNKAAAYKTEIGVYLLQIWKRSILEFQLLCTDTMTMKGFIKDNI